MSPARTALAVAVAVPALTAVVLTAFAWPAVRGAPDGVPLVVAGPPAAVEQVEARLDSAAPGAFALTAAPDAAAAERLVLDREAYGAVVVGAPPRVLTATAASPAVAGLLEGVARSLGAETRDLAALPADDPRGSGIPAAALPLVIAGIALGALASLRVPVAGPRLVSLLVGAPLAGLVLAGLLQGWLGALGGSYLANAGVVALGVLAVSTALAGLFATAGLRAFGAGAATLVLLGNPLSGATGAPELLPAGWGTLGQLLPPGAVVDALRGTAFFDGAGTSAPLLVLGIWTAIGLALLAAAVRRSPSAAPVPRPAAPASLATPAR